jgi:hypothetical protein
VVMSGTGLDLGVFRRSITPFTVHEIVKTGVGACQASRASAQVESRQS